MTPESKSLMKTCLVVVFNHRYDINIGRIKKLYENKFSSIRLLMPFYSGSDPDVITVYESSYQFQGMVAQAKEKLLFMECDYYFFISDDLLLNPIINEDNYIDELKLNIGDSFLPGGFKLQNSPWTVERVYNGIQTFYQVHTIFQKELMTRPEAKRVLARYGMEDTSFSIDNFWKLRQKKLFLSRYGMIKTKRMITLKELPYPLVGGYSDIFIIPRGDLNAVCDKFGVTAAMGLFAEIAIPTIMHLYCGNLRSLKETGYKDGSIWNYDEIESLGNVCGWSINNLFERFPVDKLYIHPIKLSKWDI